MSVESFLFEAVLLLALTLLPKAKPQVDTHDELASTVVMDLLQGPDYRDGRRE